MTRPIPLFFAVMLAACAQTSGSRESHVSDAEIAARDRCVRTVNSADLSETCDELAEGDPAIVDQN